MTKAELAKLYAEATGMPVSQAKEDLDKLGDIMAAELLGGGEAPLPGIGKLHVKATPARKGRNPHTGESIEIPAGKRLAVSAGKEFKDALKDERNT